jgi:tetratricopeptide (TPR) repeat protein
MLSGRRRIILPILIATFAARLAVGGPRPSITFQRDVAPIIYRHCAVCHQPGQAGPFSLLNYDDVKRHARQIARVIQIGYMPPWLPEHGYGDFEGEQRLTKAEIRTIADWVAEGAPEGDAREAGAQPEIVAEGWRLGKPDLILKAGQPLRVPAGSADVFWNFTFRPQLSGRRYVKGIEIHPGGGGALVHHANLLLDRTHSADRLEAKAGSGFPGMELTLNRNPLDPPSHFLFWKPGSTPRFEQAGLAWRLDPGNVLVLNTHLQPSGKPEEVQPEIALYFTDEAPTRFPLLVELEADNSLDVPAGMRDFPIGDDFKLPIDVDVLAIYPHAHYLGKLLEAYATLPDGKRVWLIRIPDWNFDWQAVYRYKSPVALPAGSVVSMRFHYDNSAKNVRNPNHPPKRVVAGNRASDEMAHLWLQLLPRGRGDRRRELEEAVERHRVEKDPRNFSAHLNLGALLLSRLRTQEAIDQLQTALKLNASSAEAHDMLGSALRSVGRSQEAIGQFRAALRANPDYIEARYDLAASLARAGDYPGAIENFRPVIEAFPNDSRLRNEWGEMLARSGDLSGALQQFEKAIQLDPANRDAAKNRDWVLTQRAQR